MYRQVLVLLALLSEEKNNSNFIAVREQFERLVLPPKSEDGQTALVAIKAAMSDFSHSMEERRRMSWSVSWLEDVGVIETNPVTCGLFAVHWMNFFAAVVKSLREFRPSTFGLPLHDETD
jgi:hypothetical protein